MCPPGTTTSGRRSRSRRARQDASRSSCAGVRRRRGPPNAYVPAPGSVGGRDHGPMAVPTRRLGSTGLEVSELGYGAWGISQVEWIGADDGESLRALRRSIELGVDFVDTALAYGDGQSEELVGQVVRESTHVRVASKVPPKNWEWP